MVMAEGTATKGMRWSDWVKSRSDRAITGLSITAMCRGSQFPQEALHPVAALTQVGTVCLDEGVIQFAL